MISTSRDMVLSFVDSLVPTVKKALCDSDPAGKLLPRHLILCTTLWEPELWMISSQPCWTR